MNLRNIIYRFSIRTLFTFSIVLLCAFSTGDTKSEYNIPIAPYSITSVDLLSDNDKDVIIGHLYSFINEWSGITIMTNNGEASFQIDSFYLYDHHWDILAGNIDTDFKYDLVTQGYYNQNYAIAVLYNIAVTTNDIQYLYINYYPDYISFGKINDDIADDIFFCNNQEKVFGLILNDGEGNFSSPTYSNLNFSPTDIKSGKLNEDNYDDIVIGGAKLVIKFSQGTSFQTLTFDDGAVDIEITDLDNDGDSDIIGYDDLYYGTQIRFYENLGNNDFLKHDDWDFSPGCYYMTVSDFNNDSLPDLFFHTNADNGMYFYYNLGEFQFDSPIYFPFTNYGESSRKSLSADFDNNGYNDLVIVRSTGQQLPVGNVTFLFNDGNGNFVEDPITEIEIQKSKNHHSKLYCYPNPFSKETTISFSVKENEKAQLQVFELNGRLVNTITNKELHSGKHKFKWNGTDKNGKEVNTGVYMVQLVAGGQNYSCRIIYSK